jgi:hypothetical protein
MPTKKREGNASGPVIWTRIARISDKINAGKYPDDLVQIGPNFQGFLL